MSRFYFHLRASEQLVSDEDGQDLPDGSAAKLEAIASAREILAAAIRFGQASLPDALVIEDEAGREIDTVPLATVVPESLKKYAN
jgi:hypothetical protein